MFMPLPNVKAVEGYCVLVLVLIFKRNMFFLLQEYTPSTERKEDQDVVDKQILGVVRQHPEKKYLFGYLGAMFSLKNGDCPHKMIF